MNAAETSKKIREMSDAFDKNRLLYEKIKRHQELMKKGALR